jgi:transposase
MRTPSAQTLDDVGVREIFQELEEVPMTMVGGFDVHRQQITFDYVDDDGVVHWGQIRPATRKTLRAWLAEHCPGGDGGFGLEGCTGWRYVSEELAVAGVGVHLGDPAETAAARGRKKRAKTDHADAKLLRTLLLEGRFPESWIPPAHMLEIRTLGRLYCSLIEERRAWQQRIHAQLFHQGCPPVRALLSEAGRAALAGTELSAAGRQYVQTALRRVDELTPEIDTLRTQLVNFARHQPGCRALQTHYGIGWLCAAIMWAEIGDARRFSSSQVPDRRDSRDIRREDITIIDTPVGFADLAVHLTDDPRNVSDAGELIHAAAHVHRPEFARPGVDPRKQRGMNGFDVRGVKGPIDRNET